MADTADLSPADFGRESSNLSVGIQIQQKREHFMATDIWKVTYRILKVNKQPYTKLPDMIREHRENMTGVVQKAAEKLADRFDFGLVEVVAESMNTKEVFRFTHQSDDGFRADWQVGRQ